MRQCAFSCRWIAMPRRLLCSPRNRNCLFVFFSLYSTERLLEAHQNATSMCILWVHVQCEKCFVIRKMTLCHFQANLFIIILFILSLGYSMAQGNESGGEKCDVSKKMEFLLVFWSEKFLQFHLFSEEIWNNFRRNISTLKNVEVFQKSTWFNWTGNGSMRISTKLID